MATSARAVAIFAARLKIIRAGKVIRIIIPLR
jgi:hypothetical protein